MTIMQYDIRKTGEDAPRCLVPANMNGGIRKMSA